MAVPSWLQSREIIPSVNAGKGRYLEKVINGFECYSQDEYHVHGEMGMALPPFTAKFSQGLLNGHLLGVADEDGNIQLIDSRKQKINSVIKGWSAHSNAIFDIAWVGNEPKLVTASGDQTARLWDVEKAETLGIFRGHTCSLKSINLQFRSSSVFATGARDGKIMLWDTRCHMKNGYYGPINVIHGAHVRVEKNSLHINSRKRKPRRASVLSSDSKQSVTAVVFQDENIIISSGACDGTIKMWDIRKNYSAFKEAPIAYHMIPYPDQSASRKHGYSSLVLDSTSSRLFATCINDVIYAYHSSNLATRPFASFYGHQSSTFYIKSSMSPDDRFLLSGSGDDNCYVFKVDEPHQPPWVLKGHVGEVTSVSWCPSDLSKIATCSDDNTFRIWRSFGKLKPSNDAANNQIGACVRDGSMQHLASQEQMFYTNNRLNIQFRDISSTCKPNINGLMRTPKTPTFLDDSIDSMSCGSLTSAESPVVPAKRCKGIFSTPKGQTESPIIVTPSSTPKNSRLLLEKWLKASPSPSPVGVSPETNKSLRNTLKQKNSDRKVFDHTPRRKIILCARPSSEPKVFKRKNIKTGTLTRSATKRKLVSDDKENPPSKTIRMCFDQARLSPKLDKEKNEFEDKKDDPVPSARRRRPLSNNQERDILDQLDELPEDEEFDKEKSPKGKI